MATIVKPYNSILDFPQGIGSVARICHAANNELRVSLGEEESPAFNMSRDMQVGTCKGVLTAMLLLRDGYDVTGEFMHQNWVRDKLDAGWKYGEVLDREAKTHPNMKEYSELAKEQHWKDDLFIAICRALRKTCALEGVVAQQ